MLKRSPQQAWHGVRQWRLHLLVLATTFVIFPLLGLAVRALVSSVLTIDRYNGLLFLCLVPSTVQSSIAFTSIAGATSQPPSSAHRCPTSSVWR